MNNWERVCYTIENITNLGTVLILYNLSKGGCRVSRAHKESTFSWLSSHSHCRKSLLSVTGASCGVMMLDIIYALQGIYSWGTFIWEFGSHNATRARSQECFSVCRKHKSVLMMLNYFLNGQSLCIFIDTPANGLHELSFSPKITYICYHVLVFVYFV